MPPPLQAHSKPDAIIFDACFTSWKAKELNRAKKKKEREKGRKKNKLLVVYFQLRRWRRSALLLSITATNGESDFIHLLRQVFFRWKCTAPFRCIMIEMWRKIDGIFPLFSNGGARVTYRC